MADILSWQLIVLSDRRAVLWKQYSYHPGPPGSIPCQAIPFAGDGSLDDDASDTCIGEVYDMDGRAP